MTTQPTALKIADALESQYPDGTVKMYAAAELRRLHAENVRLLKWQELAFTAHPNIDLDIEAARKALETT